MSRSPTSLSRTERSHRRDSDLRRRILGRVEKFAVLDIVNYSRSESVDGDNGAELFFGRHR